MSKKVLVVAAHPDDEALGCGASMARHAASGDRVYACYMTGGVGARSGSSADSERRRVAAVKAGQILGVTKQFFFDYPDNGMDTVSLLEIVRTIEQVVEEVQPETIYTHFQYDLNIDHRLTHQAVVTACRPQPGQPVKEIMCFEILSSTDWQGSCDPAFRATVINDVTQYFQHKTDALRCYGDEMREFPHSRSFKSVEALAVMRGASYGLEKAEAFQLVRHIR